jgi:hypothetical protein
MRQLIWQVSHIHVAPNPFHESFSFSLSSEFQISSHTPRQHLNSQANTQTNLQISYTSYGATSIHHEQQAPTANTNMHSLKRTQNEALPPEAKRSKKSDQTNTILQDEYVVPIPEQRGAEASAIVKLESQVRLGVSKQAQKLAIQQTQQQQAGQGQTNATNTELNRPLDQKQKQLDYEQSLVNGRPEIIERLMSTIKKKEIRIQQLSAQKEAQFGELTEVIDNLYDKIKELKSFRDDGLVDVLEELWADKRKLGRLCDQLREKNVALEQELKHASEDAEKLAASNKTLLADDVNLLARIYDVEDDNTALREEIEAISRKITRKSHLLEEATAQLESERAHNEEEIERVRGDRDQFAKAAGVLGDPELFGAGSDSAYIGVNEVEQPENGSLEQGNIKQEEFEEARSENNKVEHESPERKADITSNMEEFDVNDMKAYLARIARLYHGDMMSNNAFKLGKISGRERDQQEAALFRIFRSIRITPGRRKALEMWKARRSEICGIGNLDGHLEFLRETIRVMGQERPAIDGLWSPSYGRKETLEELLDRIPKAKKKKYEEESAKVLSWAGVAEMHPRPENKRSRE